MTDTELTSPSSPGPMVNQRYIKDGGRGGHRGMKRGGSDFATSAGGGGHSRRNANWDDGNFELDKLHLQFIEKSTTEEEFANFVLENCNIIPEFTKFIHRDGYDWWFCFQKFSSPEDAEAALQFLKSKEYKGKRIKAMYARKKETMPSYQQKMQYQQQKQQQLQNYQQNGGQGSLSASTSSQYQDYYQESYQDVATMDKHREGGGGDANRGSDWGRRGATGFSHRGGGVPGRGLRRHHLNNHQSFQGECQANNVNAFDSSAGYKPTHHYSGNNDSNYPSHGQNYSQRGANAMGSRPRGAGTTRANFCPMDDNNNNSFYPPSMRSRLGPKYVQKGSGLEASATSTASATFNAGAGQGTFTKKEKKKDVFWISDLKFVKLEPEFKATCVLVETPKNIILQVENPEVNKHAMDKFSKSLQEVGSSLKRIINPEPGRVCLAKTKQSTAATMQMPPETVSVNEGVESGTMTSSNEFLFERAVLLSPQPTSDQLNTTGASGGTGDAVVCTLNAASSGPPLTNLDDLSSDASETWKVELIDSAEIVEVEVSNMFNIDKESLQHPVATFHACFSAFEVKPGDAKMKTIMEYIGIGLSDNNPIFKALRTVYNWVDIEAEIDDPGEGATISMTELLLTTDDIILTEASAEWTRHSNVSEIILGHDYEYLGTVTHVKSPAEFYVQLEQVVPSSNSESSTANQNESSVSNHEAVRALLYETLPSFDLTEIPYYRPFPFELVCVRIDNIWMRAQVTQLGWWPSCEETSLASSAGNTSVESAISATGATSQVEVFCVDHGYSAIVKVSDIRPMMDQFIFQNSTSGASSQKDVIPAQAIKVALPGAIDEKFNEESLDLFRSEVFRQKVEMKVHKMRSSANSPDPYECSVKKVTQVDSEGPEELDLLQLCVSKGILTNPMLPPPGARRQEAGHAIKVEDLESEILGASRGNSVHGGTKAFDVDLTPTKREGDVGAEEICREEFPSDLRKSSRPLHQFDEDSSTQFSSDYLDGQIAGVSEKYVEALQEEIVQLKEKVEKLEAQMEEMNEFKGSVMKQLKKFRSAFGAD